MRISLPVLALAAIAAPLSAANPVEGETITVRIEVKDIELTSAEGRAQLEQRVDAQLRQACTISTNSRFAYGRDIVDESCVAGARSAALAQAERIAVNRARRSGQIAAK